MFDLVGSNVIHNMYTFQSKRGIKYYITAAPGPGTYGLPSMLVARKDFNKAEASSNFHKPIAHITEKMEKKPAPNSYDVCYFICFKVVYIQVNFYGVYLLDRRHCFFHI